MNNIYVYIHISYIYIYIHVHIYNVYIKTSPQLLTLYALNYFTTAAQFVRFFFWAKARRGRASHVSLCTLLTTLLLQQYYSYSLCTLFTTLLLYYSALRGPQRPRYVMSGSNEGERWYNEQLSTRLEKGMGWEHKQQARKYRQEHEKYLNPKQMQALRDYMQPAVRVGKGVAPGLGFAV